jgi:DHA1 family multidrug resistance protein-like MFS transporter
LYIFITSYEIVFIQIYGFNLGENGLAFLVGFLSCLKQIIFLTQLVRRVNSSAHASRISSSSHTSSK